MPSDAFQQARSAAVRYLSLAARSEAGLRARLERAEYPSEIVEAVVEECRQRGWIDDEAMAGQWVADRAARKNYGGRRLAEEMRRQGLPRQVVEEALQRLSPEEELEHARAALLKRLSPEQAAGLGPQEKQAELRRHSQFLMRRGFDVCTIEQVMREWLLK